MSTFSFLWIVNRIGRDESVNNCKMRLTSMFNLSGGGTGNESRHTAVKSTVSEYVQKSTIHGVAYIGDDERNKFERIWWFIMLVCSVFGACYLIYQAYRTMKENPIIESPSLTRTPMWEVPFPAATFCPVSKDILTSFALDKTNWPEFAQNSLTDNLIKMIDDGQLIISLILESLLLRRNDENNYDILRQVLPEINVEYATFGSFPTEVNVSLQRTIIEYGPCVTVNMYQEKDILRDGVVLSSLNDATDKTEQLWNRDSGFINNLPIANYTNPFRPFAPGHSLRMGFNVNDSQRFSGFDPEFVVLFHAPDEVPLLSRHAEFVRIKSGKYSIIEITAHLVVSEGIEHYDPEVRQCYYSNERHLKFYKSYTQDHCETECLANYSLAQCGCVPYHLPHFSDTKLCTTDYQCYDLESVKFFLPEFKDEAVRSPMDDCNCLSSCTQLSYETVRTTATKDGNDGDNHTSVFIRHKYPQLKKHVRTELHSISEFFSNCGGSLGLFLGVSIFSILELLYFCTVRLYLHSKKRSVESNE